MVNVLAVAETTRSFGKTDADVEKGGIVPKVGASGWGFTNKADGGFAGTAKQCIQGDVMAAVDVVGVIDCQNGIEVGGDFTANGHPDIPAITAGEGREAPQVGLAEFPIMCFGGVVGNK